MSQVEHRGVGVAITNAQRTRFFVQRKDENYAPHPRGYSFFGGACEADETDAEALCRELEEELGPRNAKLVNDAALRCIRTDVVGPTQFHYALFEAIVDDATLEVLAEGPVYEGECGVVLSRQELLDRPFVWGLDAVVANYVESLPLLHIRPLTEADRASIANWHYDDELSIYDPGQGAAELRAPDHVAFASADGTLVGYGTLGVQAQVPGGRYDDRALDLGIGLRPDLVGKGHGAQALDALLVYAESRATATASRVTVAAVNTRATALVTRAGFVETHRFRRERDDREFVQYELRG